MNRRLSLHILFLLLFALPPFLHAQNYPVHLWKKKLIDEPRSRQEKEITSKLGINPNREGFLTETELKERAKNLIKRSLTTDALEIYNPLVMKNPDLLEEMAGATFSARRYAEAAGFYRSLWDHPLPGQDRPKILSLLATSLVRSDQFETALHYNREMLRLFPKTRYAKIAEEKIPFITLDSGQYEKAREGYSGLISSRKDLREILKFHWRRFWCSYLLRDYGEALRDLEFLSQSEKSKPKRRGLAYWQARLQEQTGLIREAQKIYQNIVREKSSDYYGYLAGHRLQRMRLNPVTVVDLPLLPVPRLPYGNYPALYSNWLDKLSREGGTDKWLTLALIRQESHFKPAVLSKSYAIGLMQMIPQTAYQVAEEMKLAGFHHEDLFDPRTNIRMGGHYIKTLLTQFDGRLPYAVAAYNAGPEAVTRWRWWADSLPPDEFIELIPYEETREYVKKVLTNYWVYKKLYE